MMMMTISPVHTHTGHSYSMTTYTSQPPQMNRENLTPLSLSGSFISIFSYYKLSPEHLMEDPSEERKFTLLYAHSFAVKCCPLVFTKKNFIKATESLCFFFWKYEDVLKLKF